GPRGNRVRNKANLLRRNVPAIHNAPQVLARDDNFMREPQRKSADEINEAKLPVFRASLILVDRSGEPAPADRAFPRVIANDLVHCRPASEEGRNGRLEAARARRCALTGGLKNGA